MMDRICSKCGTRKPLEEFYFDRGRPRANCKDCHKAMLYAKRAEDPDHQRALHRAFHERHAEERRARMRRYWAETKGARNAYQREAWDRDKDQARKAVAKALLAGELRAENCLFCDEPEVEAHHHSYEREDWLSVTWLCRQHHGLAHRSAPARS